MNNEQELVDICFSLAMAVNRNESFRNLSNPELAEWVAEQLKGCGFETRPMGMSWGVLGEQPKVVGT